MSRVRAHVEVEGLASEAEALWYDTGRWATFVDGLAHVDKVEDGWPARGGRVVWTSRPGGRGRVVERVVGHEARTGQQVEVEDEQVTGTQTVAFRAVEGGRVRVVLELDYTVKERRALMPLVDLLFIRRAQRDTLRRTLRRFAVELRAEREAG